MKDHKVYTTLLRDAFRVLGRNQVGDLLPPGLRLVGGTHDTGCQVSIQISEKDLDPMTIWAGSIWYSSAYEFNDRDKVLGLNPEFKTAEPIVLKFFETVEFLMQTSLVNEVLEGAKVKAQEDIVRDKAVARYLLKIQEMKNLME